MYYDDDMESNSELEPLKGLGGVAFGKFTHVTEAGKEMEITTAVGRLKSGASVCVLELPGYGRMVKHGKPLELLNLALGLEQERMMDFSDLVADGFALVAAPR